MCKYLFESVFSILLHHVLLLGLTLRNSNVFHSGGTILYPQRQCMKAPLSPHPANTCYLLFFVLFCWCFFNSHSSVCEVKLHWGFDLKEEIKVTDFETGCLGMDGALQDQKHRMDSSSGGGWYVSFRQVT